MNLPACSGLAPLTPLPTDNRQGLRNLAYRVGTHASFLESMLARLTTHAFDRSTGQTLRAPRAPGRSAPLAALRVRDGNDPSIALLDAWSCLADVLTFYQERLANEGYLRTANERRSIEELARLVGYQLKPGLSASTHLAFTIEQDSDPVLIPKGTPANTIPGPGELLATFETSEDFEARKEWNEIKPRTSRYPNIRLENAQLVSKLYAAGTSLDLAQNDLLAIQFADSTTPIPRFVERLEVLDKKNQTIVHLRDSDTALPAYQRNVLRALKPLIEALEVDKWEYHRVAPNDEPDLPQFIEDRRATLKSLLGSIDASRTAGLASFDNMLRKEIEGNGTLPGLGSRNAFKPFTFGDGALLEALSNVKTGFLDKLEGNKQAVSDQLVSLASTYKSLPGTSGKLQQLRLRVQEILDSTDPAATLISNTGLVTTLIADISGVLKTNPVAALYLPALTQWKTLVSGGTVTDKTFFEKSKKVLTALETVTADLKPDDSATGQQPTFVHWLARVADDRYRVETQLELDAAPPTVLNATKPPPSGNAAEQLLLQMPFELAESLLTLDGLKQSAPLERAAMRFQAENVLSLTVEGRFDSQIPHDPAPALAQNLTVLLEYVELYNPLINGKQASNDIGMAFKFLLTGSGKRLPIIEYFRKGLETLEKIENLTEAKRFQLRIAESFRKAFGISQTDQQRYDAASIDGSNNIAKAATSVATSLGGAAGTPEKALAEALLSATVDRIRANETAAKLIDGLNADVILPHESLVSAKFLEDLRALIEQVKDNGIKLDASAFDLILTLQRGIAKYLGASQKSGYPGLLILLDPGPREAEADPLPTSIAGQVFKERRDISKRVRDLVVRIVEAAELLPVDVPEINAIREAATELKANLKPELFVFEIDAGLHVFLEKVLRPATDLTYDLTALFSKLPLTRDGKRARTLVADIRARKLQLTAARAVERVDLSSPVDRTFGGLSAAARELRPVAIPRVSEANNAARPDTTSASDASARVLLILDPNARQNLFARWRNAPPIPPKFAVFAFRHRASLFGHSAPRHSGNAFQPIGSPTANQEWDVSVEEKNNIVFLEREFKDVSPPSDGPMSVGFLAIATRSPTENLLAAPTIYLIEQVNTESRAAYGLSGKTTRIELREEWRKLEQGATIAPLRTTNAFVAPYLIELVDEPFRLPIGRFDRRIGSSGRAQNSAAGSFPTQLEIDIPDDLLERSDNEVELDDLLEGLEAGRAIVISGERADAPGALVQETVQLDRAEHIWRDWPKERPHTLLKLKANLRFAYRRESVTLFANVVEATHGETRSEIAGSGNAAAKFQQFVLSSPDVSHRPSVDGSAAKPEIQVRVNDVLWERREDVAQLEADEAYVSRVAGNSTTLQFGDGERGARLPSGIENVRADYRTGIGKVGNVKRGQISQMPAPVLGVRAVSNPVPGGGGVDPESIYLARESTGRLSTALGRLISLVDYENFARNFGGVAKSTAFETVEAGRTTIQVRVALVDDAPFSGAELPRNLRLALLKASSADVDVQAEPRKLAVLVVAARVGVKSRFRPDLVLARVRQALLERFSFDRSRFGQTLQRSEAIETIQRVEGVEYVDVWRFGVIREQQTSGVAPANDGGPTNLGGDAPSGSPTSPANAPQGESTNGAKPLPNQDIQDIGNVSHELLRKDEISYFPPGLPEAISLVAEGGTP